MKSIDLTNLENACECFGVKSLLVVGQVPPLDYEHNGDLEEYPDIIAGHVK